MKFMDVLNSATLGEPKRLRPMIIWTMIEYLLRGAPYGFTIMIIWLIFEPLQNPNTPFNLNATIFSCIGLFITLVLLVFANVKSFFASYKDGYEICSDGRLNIVSHLRKLPMGFYNSKDPGDIGAYIVNDYANIETLVTHLLPQFAGAITMPLVALISLMFFNWKLALIATLVIPLAWPLSKLSYFIIRKAGIKHQKTKIEASSRMIEYIQGIKIIKAFNLSDVRFERLEHAFRKLKSDSIKLEAGSGPTMILASSVLNSGLILITLFGMSFLFAGELSLPFYIMFLVIGGRVYEPLIHALMFLAELNYMQLGVERVEKLRKIELLKDGEQELDSDFTIDFRDVDFSYNSVKVLKNISLSIPTNSFTAFVGPSGSGKTTLTRVIARFWDVDSGEIFIGKKDIKSLKIDNLLSKISIVFQDVYLFNDTIYNNIRVGKEDATEQEILEAAKIANCHDFISLLANGYQTVVGESGNTLSGGEKQRISIARAILKNAPIILLDEATASLDPENELYIQQAIDNLVKEKTVIVVAHRLNTIKRADKIVVIDKGEIVEEGKHNDLIKNNSLYKKLWDEQQKVKEWRF
ncbi:ABC transporter ATP-binding protein [bacterium]|nr:ABC transporter ATP-binding protein [bacterium]